MRVIHIFKLRLTKFVKKKYYDKIDFFYSEIL